MDVTGKENKTNEGNKIPSPDNKNVIRGEKEPGDRILEHLGGPDPRNRVQYYFWGHLP